MSSTEPLIETEPLVEYVAGWIRSRGITNVKTTNMHDSRLPSGDPLSIRSIWREGDDEVARHSPTHANDRFFMSAAPTSVAIELVDAHTFSVHVHTPGDLRNSEELRISRDDLERNTPRAQRFEDFVRSTFET